MKHWSKYSDDDLIELSKKYKNNADFAKFFGMKKNSRIFDKKLSNLGIKYDNSNENKISKDDFQKAVKKSKSIAEVIENLGLSKNQNNHYKMMNYLSKIYKIELPKYDLITTNQYISGRFILSDDEFFALDTNRSGSNIRNRMLDKGIKYVCANVECPLHEKAEWCGKRITLQVDHINGENTDNRFENLRFLCANCHTQTETYGKGKNIIDPKTGFCSCGRTAYKSVIKKGCTHQEIDRFRCECGKIIFELKDCDHK